MSFNQIEDAFLAAAIEQLKVQYEAVYGRYPSRFYLGNGIRFMTINEGQDSGKLTIGQTIDGKIVPDPSIKPVDCYNLIRQGEGLAEAVRRVFLPNSSFYYQSAPNQ